MFSLSRGSQRASERASEREGEREEGGRKGAEREKENTSGSSRIKVRRGGKNWISRFSARLLRSVSLHRFISAPISKYLAGRIEPSDAVMRIRDAANAF